MAVALSTRDDSHRADLLAVGITGTGPAPDPDIRVISHLVDGPVLLTVFQSRAICWRWLPHRQQGPREVGCGAQAVLKQDAFLAGQLPSRVAVRPRHSFMSLPIRLVLLGLRSLGLFLVTPQDVRGQDAHGHSQEGYRSAMTIKRHHAFPCEKQQKPKKAQETRAFVKRDTKGLLENFLGLDIFFCCLC